MPKNSKKNTPFTINMTDETRKKFKAVCDFHREELFNYEVMDKIITDYIEQNKIKIDEE